MCRRPFTSVVLLGPVSRAGRTLTRVGPISGGHPTGTVELAIESEPDLEAELRDLVLKDICRPDELDDRRSIGARVRARCESHAGLDINSNDMLTPVRG